MLKALIQVICLFLPWPLRRRALRAFCGFSIDPGARVGLSIILADEVEMARGAGLGHFNYIGRLDKLVMEEEAFIGNLNWILGLSQRLNSRFYTRKPNRRSELVLGRCSMMGHQNYIDCTDRVELRPFSALAGARSQLLTHGVEPIASRQTCGPIVIGDFTMVGSGCMIMKGVKIPSCCIVSAGSTVSHARPESYALIAGNPAVQIRKLPETAGLFSRTTMVIH
jgi:acetyltransferase-like isoleucine patch superfamily enzyme